MGFHYGTNSIPGFVAELAAELAATDDFTMYDDQASTGYCLKYKDQNLYMLIETVTNGEYGPQYYSGSYYYARFAGVGVRFSTGWNIETHAPADTIRRWALAPLFCENGTPSGARMGVDSSFQFNYWVDKYGFQGIVQNPYSENQSSGAFFSCEFLPDATKEFADGYTNIMAYTKRNYAYWVNGGCKPPAGSTAYYYHALRPFGLAETGDTNIVESALRAAFRSAGNSKIYFEFPTYENELTNWMTPIAQTRRWFFVQESGGMSLNDVVSWLDPDNITVHKYFITAATCPDSAAKVVVAIPYENAFQY